MAGKRWYTPSPEQEAVAAELYELREALGHQMSLRATAAKMEWAAPKLSEIETATRPIAEDELLRLLQVLKAQPEQVWRLKDLRAVEIDPKNEWFASYGKNRAPSDDKWPSDKLKYVMRAEERAKTIYSAQERAFPALLQTSGYATELLKTLGYSGAELQEAVKLRAGRQNAFFKTNSPGVRLHIILSESLLRKGPSSVLSEQLDHVLRMQRAGRIECRIVPETTLLAVLGFVLMDFSFRRSIGYADGGLNELDVVKMRDTKRLAEMRDRYSLYSGMALSPDESANLIEKTQKGL